MNPFVQAWLSALEPLSTPVWCKDAQGRYLWCNRAFQRFVGRPLNEVTGLTDLDLLEPDSASRLAVYDKQALEQGSATSSEMPLTALSGSDRRFIVERVRMSMPGGTWLFGLMQDVTDREVILRQVETLLNELQAQRHALHEHAIVSISNEQDRFSYVSKQYCRLTGYSSDELTKMTRDQLQWEASGEGDLTTMHAALREGRSWTGEVKGRCKDGGTYWVHTLIVPMVDEDRGSIHHFEVSTDVTAIHETARLLEAEVATRTQELAIANQMLEADVKRREEIESTLRGQHALVNSILSSLHEQLVVLAQDGTIKLVNAAWERYRLRFAGAASLHASVIGDNFLSRIEESGNPHALEIAMGVREVLAGNQPRFDFEYTDDTKEGVRWFALHVTPWVGEEGGAVISQRDITEQHEMARINERLISIVELTPDAVFTFSPEGRLLYLNRAAATQFSVRRNARGDAEQEYSVSDLAPDDGLSGALPAALEKGFWLGELTLGGAARPMPMSIAALTHYDDQHRPSQVTLIARDIGELKKSSEELERRNRDLTTLNKQLEAVQNQLLQSEKMASIGQLAAGVAHEINNPIGFVNSNLGSLEGYVNNFIELLDEFAVALPLVPDESVRKHIEKRARELDVDFLKEDLFSLLQESKDGITRVKKIVQDLKDFSRVDESQDWAYADLHGGLDSTLNIVRNELKYKAEVIRDYGELPEVECLASQLNQVFMNMLVNAGHAIETSGTIWMRTGRQDKWVWVEFEDTGKGIAAEHLSRIFDPFFTTKPIGTGTGLGLSLSYGIVQKHQGRIDVESRPGVGTRFRIWLPIHHNDAGDPPPTPAWQPAGAAESRLSSA